MMTYSLQQLSFLCEELIQALPNGGVILLRGDLACGKTTLTQSFARVLGLDDAVTSPTFSLQQQYGEKLFHYDLYNYGLEKFLHLGMMEELERGGYHLVEWGDEHLELWLQSAGFAYAVVTITKSDEQSRNYEVKYGK
jgi:tRNA threonylcarbamoyladenosine biosynthesis protein TsaE